MGEKGFWQIFFSIFIGFGIITWLCSFVLHPIFMKVVHIPGQSEAELITLVRSLSYNLFTAILVLYTAFQVALLLRKKGVVKHVALRIAGSLAKIFLLGAGLSSIVFLFNQKPNAEGLEILLILLPLAFVSGIITYSKTVNFDFKGLIVVLLAWLAIIFVNEMIIQEVFIPSVRVGQASDIIYNMKGVGIGLLLSIGWFWLE